MSSKDAATNLLCSEGVVGVLLKQGLELGMPNDHAEVAWNKDSGGVIVKVGGLVPTHVLHAGRVVPLDLIGSYVVLVHITCKKSWLSPPKCQG